MGSTTEEIERGTQDKQARDRSQYEAKHGAVGPADVVAKEGMDLTYLFFGPKEAIFAGMGVWVKDFQQSLQEFREEVYRTRQLRTALHGMAMAGLTFGHWEQMFDRVQQMGHHRGFTKSDIRELESVRNSMLDAMEQLAVEFTLLFKKNGAHYD